jgi:hypothetical protein
MSFVWEFSNFDNPDDPRYWISMWCHNVSWPMYIWMSCRSLQPKFEIVGKWNPCLNLVFNVKPNHRPPSWWIQLKYPWKNIHCWDWILEFEDCPICQMFPNLSPLLYMLPSLCRCGNEQLLGLNPKPLRIWSPKQAWTQNLEHNVAYQQQIECKNESHPTSRLFC